MSGTVVLEVHIWDGVVERLLVRSGYVPTPLFRPAHIATVGLLRQAARNSLGLSTNQQSNGKVYDMSNAHQHPGVILASVLKDRSITDLELAEGTGIPHATISDMLVGKQDISQIDSIRIEGYLQGNKPGQWSGHQQIHNAWKKLH
jgi:plasmid maintenance system antidote protein VapI